MINILKTALFAGLFIAFFLVYVPLRWLLPAGTGILVPFGWIGIIPLAVGLAIVLWCWWEFATRGQGTAAPFDPPKNGLSQDAVLLPLRHGVPTIARLRVRAGREQCERHGDEQAARHEHCPWCWDASNLRAR
jgi:hypothetical protein